ncbi:MAG TPA: phosphate propanoyltransferase [Bacilli bacterium]|nr:phosphate propanoyltransferase [Bacilli bacterium]
MKVPVGVSARHVHLSQADLEALFGSGAQLHPKKPLSQPGQFASEETVDLQGPKGTIQKVRILGPTRPHTQVEVSHTDARKLGLDVPVRESGDIDHTPGLTLVGPQGEVRLEDGLIVAMRHIHFSPEDARRFGVKDHQQVMVKTTGERGVIFDHVIARVSPSYKLDFHIDTDEANAAGLHTGKEVEMIEIEEVYAVPEDFHGNEKNRAFHPDFAQK